MPPSEYPDDFIQKYLPFVVNPQTNRLHFGELNKGHYDSGLPQGWPQGNINMLSEIYKSGYTPDGEGDYEKFYYPENAWQTDHVVPEIHWPDGFQPDETHKAHVMSEIAKHSPEHANLDPFYKPKPDQFDHDLHHDHNLDELFDFWKEADFGGDVYPGEEPQVMEDNGQNRPRRDYTEWAHLPAKPQVFNWVIIGNQLHVDQGEHPEMLEQHGYQNPEKPMAFGRMAVQHRWTVHFQILHSNIALHAVEKLLSTYAKEQGYQMGPILDPDSEEMTIAPPQPKEVLAVLRDPHNVTFLYHNNGRDYAISQPGYRHHEILLNGSGREGEVPAGWRQGEITFFDDEWNEPSERQHYPSVVPDQFRRDPRFPEILENAQARHDYAMEQLRQDFEPRESAVPGIGDILPGVKDWRTKEWAEDPIKSINYYGEQDPPDDSPITDSPYQCPDCGDELGDYQSLTKHMAEAHHTPEKNGDWNPVVDYDNILAPGFNNTVTPEGVMGKVSSDWSEDEPSSDKYQGQWADFYAGDDAVRLPFYHLPDHNKVIVGMPGDFHGSPEMKAKADKHGFDIGFASNEHIVPGEVVFTNFGSPQIHHGWDDIPEGFANMVMPQAKRNMLRWQSGLNMGQQHGFQMGERPRDEYEHTDKFNDPQWAKSFKLASRDWEDELEELRSEPEKYTGEWADFYEGDDAVRLPYWHFPEHNHIVMGMPGDLHGSEHMEDKRDQFYQSLPNEELDKYQDAYGETNIPSVAGEVIFTNFGSPEIHYQYGNSTEDSKVPEHIVGPVLQKAKRNMLHWQGGLNMGKQYGYNGPWWTDKDNKWTNPEWAKSFKLAAETTIPGPIPFIFDIKHDRIYVGHPGDISQDIQGDFDPLGIVQGIYKPNGEMEIQTETNMPYTVRHMIQLWYYMHNELPVKHVYLNTSGQKLKLAQRLSNRDNVAQNTKALVEADPAASAVWRALEPHGDVYVVGGAIRDQALGRMPKDLDMMAHGIDRHTLETTLGHLARMTGGSLDFTGKHFGVFRYRHPDGSEVEIAMPRAEQSTGVGHLDFHVRTDPHMPVEQDMARRDFTPNAMAVSLGTGKFVDPFGGWDSAKAGKLPLVNESAFREDPLRVLRALSARSRYGLAPDDATERSMAQYGHQLEHLPKERLQMELDKLFKGDSPADAIHLAQRTGVLQHILPEVAATKGFDQKNPHHNEELYDHMTHVLDHVSKNSKDPDLRMAALLHDIGKPGSQWIDENGHGRYFQNEKGEGANHEELGAEMARARLHALKYPNDRVDRISHLVRHHMFPTFDNERGARRFVNRVGDHHADDLLALRGADAGNKAVPREGEVGPMRDLLQRVRTQGQPTGLSDLAINGNDLIGIGIKPGPGMGQILNDLKEKVLDDPSLNNRETLLGLAQGEHISSINFSDSMMKLAHAGYTIEHAKPNDWAMDLYGSPYIVNDEDWGRDPENPTGGVINVRHPEGYLVGSVDHRIQSPMDTYDAHGYTVPSLHVGEAFVHPDAPSHVGVGMFAELAKMHPTLPISSTIVNPKLASVIQRYNERILRDHHGYDSPDFARAVARSLVDAYNVSNEFVKPWTPETWKDHANELINRNFHKMYANVLDPIQETLDPDVFEAVQTKKPILKPHIAEWVKQHVYALMTEHGYEDPEKKVKLVLTGSLTTYQWSVKSDFDVSMFVDYKAFPEVVRAHLIGIMVDGFDGVKVPDTTHVMQCYVVARDVTPDMLYQEGLRSAWDIDKAKWIIPPEKDRAHDPYREMPSTIAYCQSQEDKMRLLLQYDPPGAKVFWDQLHRRRMRDQTAGKGDYSESNLIFKWFNNADLFPLITQVTGEKIA